MIALMKKKALTTPARSKARRKHSAGYPQLVTAISAINTQMVTRVASVANQALVLRNWMVGAYIVEFEQNGADRAKYGERLLERLAEDLKGKGIKGLGLRTLRDCRSFVAVYPQIRQPVVAESEFTEQLAQAGQPAVDLSIEVSVGPKTSIRQPLDPELPTPLETSQLARISWAHFLELIRIDDPWKRAFYENELIQGHWSKRQLQRQIESLLYERTGLSTNKKAVIERARKQEPQESIADVLRDPYILEFTGLVDRPEYSEKELESALLDHVQRFLLELGRGFCFEARQFRMTEGRKHHRVDLVFYHRLLRCHVLIDLKIRGFQPADAGQIHPVRYSPHERVSLCLHPQKSQRRKPVYRLHVRPETPTCRASGRASPVNQASFANRTDLLRSVSFSGRRNTSREVSQNCVGQEISQDPARRLSNGVNFYVNWFKANMMSPGDNPPVGILLCSDKDGAEVEFATAGMDQKLFVSRYLEALPSVKQLKAFLERDRAEIQTLTKS
jgi:predicted nuclease of restriction endonuclease-like (RecB) superfamily